MDDRYTPILNEFDLHGNEKGNVEVSCPFHDDSSASASINLQKKVFHCFAGDCVGGLSFDQLLERLGVDEEEEEEEDEWGYVELDNPPSEDELLAIAAEHLSNRGIDVTSLEEDGESLIIGDLRLRVNTTEGHKHFGYMIFFDPANPLKRYVGRNLLNISEDRPKYRNPKGDKEGVLFIKEGSGPVWLTEGIFDAIALFQAGKAPVATGLGSEVSARALYSLRNRTVFILFDKDYAGWEGARKAAETLEQFGANPIILELPDGIGNDPSDAWAQHPERFAEWLETTEAEFSTEDRLYVKKLLTQGNDHFVMMPTGIPSWDHHLQGGLMPGLHFIGAEAKVGKTGLVLQLADNAAKGKYTDRPLQVLVVSEELPKMENWVRLASRYDELPWVEIYKDPTKISDKTKSIIYKRAKNLRIVTGWGLNRIRAVAPEFDLIIVDYLQIMPGSRGREDTENHVRNVNGLSEIVREHGKILVVVSELNRQGYGKEDMSIFKGTGRIEFAAQSALLLKGPPQSNVIRARMLANRAGTVGSFFLRANKAHGIFKEKAIVDINDWEAE